MQTGLVEACRVLCDRCLGRRLVGAAGVAAQREAAAKARTWPEVPEPACPACEGVFADAPRWLEAALEVAQPYGFTTFQVGTRFPGPCEEAERSVSRAMGQEKVGETVRTEANRWLAAQLAAARPGTRTDPAGMPDLVLEVDTRYWSASAEANAVFVRGRYTKHRRDIPQTHWPCRRCQGRGCWQCDDTGVTYAESVEDAIGAPAKPLFGAAGFSFHGAGREDIDALMLGTGRPFVLELRDPRWRTADLARLEGSINAATAASGVAVNGLRMAAKEEVAAIKEAEHGKEYVAHCEAERPVPRHLLEEACRALCGAQLDQRTPDRVSHRRADLVRKRTVHAVTLESASSDPAQGFDLRVRAASGTYIKEFVSGDEGRTVPSVAGTLGVPCRVAALDVVAILDEGPATAGADHRT